MIDLDLLPALVALAETGTLTAAGRRLGLTQPAVHQQLSRLAEQAGASLYRREGRGLVLLPAGRRLAALGRDVRRVTDEALAEVHGRSIDPPVLAAGRGVWLYHLRTLPDCRPLVLDGPATLQAVRDGVARVGIAAVPPPEDLASRELWRVSERVVVPATDPLAGRSARWSDLRGRRWVLPPRGRPLREQVEARLAPLEVAVEVEGWDLIVRFVALGAGIALVNEAVPLPDELAAVRLAGARPVVYRAVWRRGDDVDDLLASL
jgi:DNA-binding transcriptional LysR family regulator